MVHVRDRVLPELDRCDVGAEEAADRPHVAVQQLVPGLGELEAELLGVVPEAARDRVVLRVHPQREVGGEHRGLALRAVRGGAGDDRLGVLRDPLPGTGGALLQLPLVLVHQLEVVVAPLDRGAGPGDLEAGGDGVLALARAVGAEPAQALRLELGALGLGADQVGVAGTVGLAHRVATGDEGDGLGVVHRHPGEGLADVVGGLQRVGLAVGALGVDVDQAHLDRAEALGELPLAAVALVAEPGVLGTPVDLLGLPDVLAAEAEAEGLQAHRLVGDRTGEDQQVGPGDLLAVLLLDRPQQAAGLVEVGVVGPGVERGEALVAVTGPTTAVVDAVGARGVPAQAHHEAAVVAEVGGPPVLGGGQHLLHVALERGDVELLELLAVVEARAERVDLVAVDCQRREVQGVGPPVLQRAGASPGLRRGRVDGRVLALRTLGGHTARAVVDRAPQLVVAQFSAFRRGCAGTGSCRSVAGRVVCGRVVRSGGAQAAAQVGQVPQ